MKQGMKPRWDAKIEASLFYHKDTRRKKATQRKYKGIKFKVDG